jgi:DNA-binding transcriptional LysR family regulator
MLRYLRTFIVAAETSSFSAAGAKLGLTQSAVSTQMRRLEQELECSLFERTGKSVVISEAGRELLPDAVRMLELFDRMKGYGRAPSANRPIDLGAISTVQATLLPKTLLRFRALYPDVHVNIVPGMSTQLLTQIDAREIDIAVIIKPRLGIPADLKWIPLLREPFVVIMPAHSPLALQELPDAMPFIRYNRRSQGGQMVDRYLKQHRLWVKDGMELDEPLVIANMVSEGLGWSIIPGELVPLATTPNLKVLPLPGRPLLREMGVLVRTTALKLPSMAALIDSLHAEMARFDQRARHVSDEPSSWR